MRSHSATVTVRGQVTIPAAVRRILGIGPGDKVVFEVEDGAVRLQPEPYTLESAFASVPPLNRPEDFEVLARLAKEEKARRTVEELSAS